MFRIVCFGPPALLRDGAQLPPGAIQPRRVALLAILAAAGPRAQSRERLAVLLWPESDEERARGSLAQALYALRRDLGSEDAILGVRELRLNPEYVESDVWDFEAHRASGSFERAADCATGEFLQGFQLPGLDEFDRWLDAERTGWAERQLEVFEQLAVLAEKRDDRAGAVRWWRRASAREPHSARIVVRLMRALARGGDRAGAIRQAEIYAAMLERELELPPDPTVLREVEEIRRGEAIAAVPGDWPVESVVPPAASVEEPAAAVEPTALPESTPVPARRFRALWLGALALIGVAAGALLLLRPGRADAVTARRLLVVPPRNGTGDSTFNLVGPMVAEWITRGLSETGLVDVIDTRTMLEATREAGDEASVRDLALGAGVGTLVAGSIFRDGDSLRIEMRLTDPATGRLQRAIDPVSAPVARPTAALEPLRQRVTGALAVMLDDRLHNWTATSSQPPTWEAYQEFLLGMRDFGPDYESALGHFRRAMALDSTYWQARLWAGMSSSNARRYPSADSIFRSLAAIRDRIPPYDRATLDYFEAGFVHGDWERSYQGAKRMVELAPGAGHALFALGNTAQITNRPAEAIAALQRIDLTRGWGPSWALRILIVISRAQHRLGRYEDELKTGARMREMEEGQGWARAPELRALAALARGDELARRVDPMLALPATETTWEDFTPGDMLLQTAREVGAHGDSARGAQLLDRAERIYSSAPPAERSLPANRRALARVLAAAGRWDAVGPIYAELLRSDGRSVEHLGAHAVWAAHSGDSALAERTLQQLQSDSTPYRFGQPALWAARIAAVLGRRDESVGLLRQALRNGFARAYQLHADPDLAGLRDFPPFIELIKPRN